MKDKLTAFEYGGAYFDIEFDVNGYVEKVWMYLDGLGFVVDLMDTTSLMSNHFKERAEALNLAINDAVDEDKPYEDWKDREGA